MPKQYEDCVDAIARKLVEGKINKTYRKGGKRYKTSPYAICSRLR